MVDTKGEMNMKKMMLVVVVLAFWMGTGLCFAETGIPNLVGTWAIEAEGGVITRNEVVGPKTHHSGDFSKITAELVVTKQQGRVFHGTFGSKKGSKALVGVIGMDNKTIFSSDEDGFAEGKIVNKNKINCIYRHSTAHDSVVAVSVWTRKK